MEITTKEPVKVIYRNKVVRKTHTAKLVDPPEKPEIRAAIEEIGAAMRFSLDLQMMEFLRKNGYFG